MRRIIEEELGHSGTISSIHVKLDNVLVSYDLNRRRASLILSSSE